MKWTLEKLKEKALECRTKSEFRNKFPGGYMACHRKKIVNYICKHMPINATFDKKASKWNEKAIYEEALKYNTRKEFTKKSPGAADAAVRSGIWNDVCKHMIFLRKSWTNEELAQEALKYNTKKEFHKKSSGAYCTANNRRILDSICKHMPKDLKTIKAPHNKKWTKEAIFEEAKKYCTRSEFKKSNEGAYDAAKTMKILDIVCAHMKLSSNSSRYEIQLINEIAKIYPTVIKLRDRKVDIKDKQYIKGFDIDAFIPELKKGIELDGEYWHSFEGMKNNKLKSGWPEEDIKNYHKIKDLYFESKGISILHITDREWIENKKQSLQKVLKFLSE